MTAPSFFVETCADGRVMFRVRVTPKAKRASISGLHNGALKVAVREAPENGKANHAVIAALAAWLERPKSSLEITAGLSSRLKTVRAEGLDAQTLVRMADQR